MNDREEIEQMAKIMCGHDCEECAKESAEFHKQTLEEARNNKCLLKNCARTLYHAGCRIILEDCIVLTKEQIEHPTDDKVIEFFAKHNEKVRKQTVEMFITEVYKELYQLGRIYALPETLDADKYGIFYLTQQVVAKIAKEQFGVEIKD